MLPESTTPTLLARLRRLIGWSPHSSVLLGGFLLTILLIAYIWWPLAEEYLRFVPWDGPWWLYMDWLLLGIFAFMTLTIMARANLRLDARIIFVGLVGGLVIESWGTQTNLWFYYTLERPPLWIIPAWPIASLSIDRLTRLLDYLAGRMLGRLNPQKTQRLFRWAHALVMAAFLALMLAFVWPTLDKSLTSLSFSLCILLVLSEKDPRIALLTFAAGAGLGYFLELWGTTRECWTYYTYQTPPLFAVLAHGMAAVAFWRAGQLIPVALKVLGGFRLRKAAEPARSGDSGRPTQGEKSVNALAEIAEISPSAVSHHLARLRSLRLVKTRRVANQVFYKVDDEHVAGLFREMLSHLEHIKQNLPDQLSGSDTEILLQPQELFKS
jgi:DNA-binding transcriptional ArsR family regulator